MNFAVWLAQAGRSSFQWDALFRTDTYFRICSLWKGYFGVHLLAVKLVRPVCKHLLDTSCVAECYETEAPVEIRKLVSFDWEFLCKSMATLLDLVGSRQKVSRSFLLAGAVNLFPQQFFGARRFFVEIFARRARVLSGDGAKITGRPKCFLVFQRNARKPGAGLREAHRSFEIH